MASRTVTCRSVSGSMTASLSPATDCGNGSDAPVSTRVCNTRACTAYEYSVSAWSACSGVAGATCDGTRYVFPAPVLFPRAFYVLIHPRTHWFMHSLRIHLLIHPHSHMHAHNSPTRYIHVSTTVATEICRARPVLSTHPVSTATSCSAAPARKQACRHTCLRVHVTRTSTFLCESPCAVPS